jgi:hypothetical protein
MGNTCIALRWGGYLVERHKWKTLALEREFKFSDQFRNSKSNGKTIDARIAGWAQYGYKYYTETKGVTPKNIVTINQYNNQLYTKPLNRKSIK